MRKIMLYILMSIALLFSNVLDVEAKSYDIDSADFIIEVNSDGSVYVTETWVVNYNGDYSRFYKTIMPESLNELECYDTIKVVSATINGEECHYTDNIDKDNRINYTYNFNSESREFSWIYHVDNDIVTYETKYLISGLTKRVFNDKTSEDTGNVVVCFRPVCAGFDKTIKNVSISVCNNAGSDIELRYINRKNWTVASYNNILAIDSGAYTSSDLIKINVAFDSSNFSDTIGEVSLSNINEIEDDNQDNSVIKFLFIIIFILTSILILLNMGDIRNKIIAYKFDRDMDKDPNILNEIVKSTFEVDNNPFTAAALSMTKSSVNLIKAFILYFIQIGVLRFEKDRCRLYKDTFDKLDSNLKEIVLGILDCCRKWVEDDKTCEYVIDPNKLYDNNYANIRRHIDKYLMELRNRLKNYYSQAYKELVHNSVKLSYYANSYNMDYNYKSIKDFIDNKYDTWQIIMLSLVTDAKVHSRKYREEFNRSDNELEESIMEFIDYLVEDLDYYNSNVNYVDNSSNDRTSYDSSSSSSGCSSCSSCSSCGGCGGAD